MYHSKYRNRPIGWIVGLLILLYAGYSSDEIPKVDEPMKISSMKD